MDKNENEMNDGEILTLAESFKQLIKLKNEEIRALHKIIMVSYSLFRLLDYEIEHNDLVERGRSLCSDALDEWVLRE
jgi:hypothetical protein